MGDGSNRARFVSDGRDRQPRGALQFLAIVVPLLLSGCLPGDVATDGSSALTPPSASIADETMQLRPVEEIGYDLPLSCGAAPCAPEVLLAVHGITLEGPDDLHFSLGDLLITGGDVAQATAIEVPMLDEGEQGDHWAVALTLTEAATAIFESATSRASMASPPQNQIALVIDGAVFLAPTVLEPIENGQLEISSLSHADAEDLSGRLGAE